LQFDCGVSDVSGGPACCSLKLINLLFAGADADWGRQNVIGAYEHCPVVMQHATRHDIAIGTELLER
jgi:hypothetical protein